jgi:tetratricopeptide (TPR) repeat protein
LPGTCASSRWRRPRTPFDPQTQFHRGWPLSLQNRHTEAVVALNIALARLSHGILERKAIGLLARAYWLAGERWKAVSTVEAGLEKYPDDPELLFTEAQTLAARGDLLGAESNLRQVLASALTWKEDVIDRSIFGAGGKYLLGVVLTLQGKHVEAEEAARAVISEVPNHVLAWIVLADAVAQLGRADKLDALAEAAPPTPRAILRASSRALDGKAEEAFAELELASISAKDPILGKFGAWVTRCSRGESHRILDFMRAERRSPGSVSPTSVAATG